MCHPQHPVHTQVEFCLSLTIQIAGDSVKPPEGIQEIVSVNQIFAEEQHASMGAPRNDMVSRFDSVEARMSRLEEQQNANMESLRKRFVLAESRLEELRILTVGLR